MNNAFDNIYDGMNFNYGKLEGILADLYTRLQEDPNDDFARDMFTRLSTVAENMIFSQKELTTYYGDPSIKNSLIGQLDSKVTALHQGLDQVRQHDL